MKIKSIITGILLSLSAYADGYYPAPTSQDQPWSITASMGSGKYPHLHPKDLKALGRLALGNELLLTGELAWGLELGLQTGNKSRLSIPGETLVVLGWLPVRTTLGPMIDLLVTAKSDPLAGSSLFAQFKGGVAYRYWQVENRSINDVSQLTGEIQAGFGYPVNALATLNLLYQGVLGNEPYFTINTSSRTGHIANIPTLHALLLGLSFNI